MTKIIAFAGRRQSGKGTSANIVHGLKMLERGMVKDFSISEGKLHIQTSNAKGDEGWGEFDVLRTDDTYVNWAEQNLWPYIKTYNFAEELKNIAICLFDIPYECVWGSNEQKNTVIPHLLWENMPGVLTPEKAKYYMFKYDDGVTNEDWRKDGITVHEPGPMTAREFLQYFGTEIGRRIYSNVWINATLKKIKREGPEIALIADARFPNELEAIRKVGAKLYKLSRKVFAEDTHYSETACDEYTSYTKIIENGGSSKVADLIEHIKIIYKEF